MSTPLPSSGPPFLVLFVAGEPETMPSLRDSGVGTGARWAAWFLPSGLLPKNLQPAYEAGHRTSDGFEAPPPSDMRPWLLPPSQAACAEMVIEIVERQQLPLLVVDVNRPGEFREMVARWVEPTGVMPLLVRPDGARLEGEENFVPGKVRRFVAGRPVR
jgi:hypothetical protein